MATKKNALERAHKSILTLKAVVRAERKRAEGNPTDRRYVDLFITDQSSNKIKCEKMIFEVFNDLEYLLDRLHITYMAACFENEAKARIATAIGEARNAIDGAMPMRSWAPNLVAAKEQYNGINDVFSVMGLSSILSISASSIREVRNAFCHGTRIENLPISSDEVLLALSQMLESLSPERV